MSSKKYYVVWKGHFPGVYDDWVTCEKQIKAFPMAQYRSFKTRVEAENAFKDGLLSYDKVLGDKQSDLAFRITRFQDEINLNSISVDAACSGNPGLMEYRGVKTATGEELFKMGPFKHATNNIGEFLALVHGLALFKKQNSSLAIYTDSKTALSWVKAKTVRTKLEQNAKNKDVFDLVHRALNWLKANSYSTQVLKWNTERWGEIPADFGRK